VGPLCRYPTPRAEARQVGPDSEVSTPLPVPRFGNRGHPLSGLTPFQSVTRASPRPTVIPRGIASARSFRGLFPFGVSELRGATQPRQIPTYRLRCALGVSHPLDALLPSQPPGLVPSRLRPWGFALRGFSPRLTPYALSRRRAPQGSSSTRNRKRPPFQGHPRQTKHQRRIRVLAEGPGRLPPWVFPLRGLLPSTEKSTLVPSHPLTRSSDLVASWPDRQHPRVFPAENVDPSLSRRANPIAVFHLVILLDSLETPQSWVIDFPQRQTRVAARPSSSSPCRRIPGRSSPRSLFR
jgi:hypothetical protein